MSEKEHKLPKQQDRARADRQTMADGLDIQRFLVFPKVSRPVFIVSMLLIVLFIVFGTLFTELAGQIFGDL